MIFACLFACNFLPFFFLLSHHPSLQMTEIGQKIAKKYKFGKESSLLPSTNYEKWIYAQSTHKPRTILSGMAFLQGAFPTGLLRLDVVLCF